MPEPGAITPIDCAGDARGRGRAHGEAARDLVRAALQRWEETTVRAAGLPIRQYTTAFLAGTGFVRAIRKRLPDLLDEITGIAEAADVPVDSVFVYNCMDEQWWYDAEQAAAEPGCSVLARAPDGAAPGLLAQNMDLPAFMEGSQIVLRIRTPGQPETLLLTSAGLIGLTGVNAAGIGVCVNTLLMLGHSRVGLPVAAVLRGALRQERLAAAVDFLTSVPHASGQHYAVGSREGMVGVECSAAGAVVSSVHGRATLIHTNHPLASEDVDLASLKLLEQRGRVGNSKARLAFLEQQIGSVAGPADARHVLADRSTPICVTPTGLSQSRTFGSVVFAFTEPPTAEFCLGLPSSSPWQVAGWNHDVQ